MKGRLPPEAKEILARGEWCYLAAATRFGPHVTPVVFALDGGRLWLTTARSSVKARAWRADPTTAGMVRAGDRALVFRGRVRSYDALDPFTWPAAALSSPRLGKAAAKFSLKNARFFFGYAVDAYRVPLAWAPIGRVFASVDVAAGRIVDLADGSILDGWGEWPRGLRAAATYTATHPGRGAAGRAKSNPGVPASIAEALGTSGSGVLSTQVLGGDRPLLTVLPAAWRRTGSAYEVTLPLTVAELTEAEPGVRASLTSDRASQWRASEMLGVLVRGKAGVFAPLMTTRGGAALRTLVGEDQALFRLTPERTVWWQGWSSGTVAAASTPRRRTRASASGRRGAS